MPSPSPIAPIDRWGPFADGLAPGERLARLRALRAIVCLCAGPRGAALADTLRRAEHDPAHLPAALAEIAALAPLDRRHVLASYAKVSRHP